MSEHRGLIESLGGSTKLAAEVTRRQDKTVTMNAVAMWKVQGIPWKWRRMVELIAEDAGVALPTGYWATPSGRDEIQKARERRAG